MAHGSQAFALVGYSEDLERKPLKFVETIPASRICSACGIIPRATYMLLCGHTFCGQCYQSCATTAELVCPLDGEVCVTADVTTKSFPAENLLRRKVHCWNEANGCRAILPASQVAEHVRHDCQHHVTRCPVCCAEVLSRDVCAHIKSQCTALVLPAAPEAQQGTNNDVKSQLVSFEKMMELRVRELDATLAELSLESASLRDKLSHNNYYLKEALTEQFRTASDRNVAEIKALCTETSESLMSSITSTLVPLLCAHKRHQRVITGYAALKEEALKEGSSSSMSGRVYLRRYLMSWGIEFEKEGENVHLLLRIQLHKGRVDDFLEWPFTKKLMLTIVHPEMGQERLLRATIEAPWDDGDCFCRPLEASNTPIGFSETQVDSSDIEREGYIKEDQLLVRLDVSL